MFPAVQYVNIVPRQDKTPGMCILQFNSSHECQKVYEECQSGKEVAGRVIRAELGESRGGGRPARQNQRFPPSDSSKFSGHSGGADDGCSLTVSNLPYTATESDVWKEFPEALKVVLTLDERGRSRGVAQVSFPNKEQCNAALDSCNYKTMSGRPIRGRITRGNENGQGRPSDQRDYGNRPARYNDEQRDFGNRPNRPNDDFGNRQGRGSMEQRDFGNRQGSQGGFNRERDSSSRFNSSFGNRGGPGGGDRGYGRGGGGGDFGNRGRGGSRFANDRPDSFGNRRDRSPGRDEPIRGYGNNKGPRITSAVINRPGGVSSESSSSSSDEN